MKQFILYISALVLFSAHLCLAGTLHVPSQYSAIQSAINSATDGDTILLQEGRYYENINKGLFIAIGCLHLSQLKPFII